MSAVQLNRKLVLEAPQNVADGAFLHAQQHIVGHFDADETVADVADGTGDAAVGDDLVALRQLFEHRTMFLGALHLRPDHDEVHHHQQQDREHQGRHQAAGAGSGGRRLGVGGGNQEIEQIHR